MGDLDDDVEPSYGTKPVTHPHSMLMQIPPGLKGHDQEDNEKSKLSTQISRSSTEFEKVIGILLFLFLFRIMLSPFTGVKLKTTASF